MCSGSKAPVDGQQEYDRLAFSPVDRLKEDLSSLKMKYLGERQGEVASRTG